jgi:hypothetical protein
VYNIGYYVLKAWSVINWKMDVVFRSKKIEIRSGYFANSIGIGTKNPSGSLHISGGDLILQSGVAYFDSKPVVGGVPILLSGEVQEPDLSDYITNEGLDLFSGALSSGVDFSISNINSSITGLSGVLRQEITNSITGLSGVLKEETVNSITGLSGSLQSQINNLNISANGASILSDYQSGISYVGRALVGSAESESAWTIKKIQLTSSGTVSGSVLKSTNSPWTGRYFLNYE